MTFKKHRALMYSDTARGLAPALMKFYNLLDVIASCENLPELETAQAMIEIAEMEYGESWYPKYSVELAKAHNGRRTIIANRLLNAA